MNRGQRRGGGGFGENLRAQHDQNCVSMPGSPGGLLRKQRHGELNPTDSDSVLFGNPVSLMSRTGSDDRSPMRPAVSVRLD